MPRSRGFGVAARISPAQKPRRVGTQRMADALVQAVSASGMTCSTRTFLDGTYTLVMPAGQHRVSSPGVDAPLLHSAPSRMDTPGIGCLR